jgi:CxxC-x17-CxxC domain-containing protein
MKKFFSKNRGEGVKPPSFEAVCADCGKDCMVPFKPNGRKPVLCSKCFNKDGSAYPDKPWEKGQGREKEMFEAECSRCGNDCQVPFRPAPGRPVYCMNCMGKDDKMPVAPRGERSTDDLASQLKVINAKLDQIIEAITG